MPTRGAGDAIAGDRIERASLTPRAHGAAVQRAGQRHVRGAIGEARSEVQAPYHRPAQPGALEPDLRGAVCLGQVSLDARLQPAVDAAGRRGGAQPRGIEVGHDAEDSVGARLAVSKPGVAVEPEPAVRDRRVHPRHDRVSRTACPSVELELSRRGHRGGERRQVRQVERARGEPDVQAVDQSILPAAREHDAPRDRARLRVDVQGIQPDLVGGDAAAGGDGQPPAAGRGLDGQAQGVDAHQSGIPENERMSGEILHPEARHGVGRQLGGDAHVANAQPVDRDAAAASRRVGGLPQDIEQIPPTVASAGRHLTAVDLELVDPACRRPEPGQTVAHPEPAHVGQLAPVLGQADVLQGEAMEEVAGDPADLQPIAWIDRGQREQPPDYKGGYRRELQQRHQDDDYPEQCRAGDAQTAHPPGPRRRSGTPWSAIGFGHCARRGVSMEPPDAADPVKSMCCGKLGL